MKWNNILVLRDSFSIPMFSKLAIICGLKPFFDQSIAIACVVVLLPICWARLLCILGWQQTPSVANDGLELHLTLLSTPQLRRPRVTGLFFHIRLHDRNSNRWFWWLKHRFCLFYSKLICLEASYFTSMKYCVK